MTRFVYSALDAAGDETRGDLEAPSEAGALEQLRARGLYPLELRARRLADAPALRAGGWRPSVWLPAGVTDVTMLLRQLALMLRSGHTVVAALEACTQLTPKLAVRGAVAAMVADIEGGSSLSRAMSRQKLFTPFMARMVAAGESGGEVDAVLMRLAVDLERKSDVRRQIITSLMYPVIVVLAAIGVTGFLVVSVVPRFATFLAARGGRLPWAADTLMHTAAFLQKWGPAIGIVMALTVFALLAARTQPATRVAVDRALLALPVIGKPLIAGAMAQLCWTLALLLKGGLSVLDSLRAGAAVARNAAVSRSLDSAAESVLAGDNFAAALAQPSIPYLLQHMVSVAQRTGELDVALESLGEHYRKELETRIRVMSTLVEPVLILVIGAIVGFVYYAFFEVVFTVSTGGGR